MPKLDPLDPPPAIAEAARSATAHAPEPEATHDGESQLVDDRTTAQVIATLAATVIATGEGQYGVIWNGELRPERYPTEGIAYFAIAALQRHEAPPIAPTD